jgi:hypothetical protein
MSLLDAILSDYAVPADKAARIRKYVSKCSVAKDLPPVSSQVKAIMKAEGIPGLGFYRRMCAVLEAVETG